MAIQHIITSTGFECDLDVEAVANDMELLDALTELEDGNGAGISIIGKKVFTKEDKKRLYDKIRVNGKVPIDKFTEEIAAVFESIKALKK